MKPPHCPFPARCRHGRTGSDSNEILGEALFAGEERLSAMPSTAIRDIFYDQSKRALWVTFVTGRRYVYDDVSQNVFDAFKTAPSRGAFFNQEIRDKYGFREVTREGGSGGNRKRRGSGG
jgi:hypothetical protein